MTVSAAILCPGQSVSLTSINGLIKFCCCYEQGRCHDPTFACFSLVKSELEHGCAMTSVNWKQRGTSATRSCRWKYFHILFLHFQANFRLRLAFHFSLTFIGRCVTHQVPIDFILIPKEYEGALRSLRSRRELWT